MTFTHDALSAAIRDGSLDGYRCGPRPGADLDMVAIDDEAAQATTCPHCNKVGMMFRPFYSEAGGYRAFLQCGCGFSQEF